MIALSPDVGIHLDPDGKDTVTVFCGNDGCQIPMPAFRATLPRNTGVWEKLTDLEVAEIAAEIANLLAVFSLYEYENRVKPDYTDAGGVTRIQSVVGDKVDTIDVDFDCDFDDNGTYLP